VIDDVEIAPALHVAFVVHWIGGVAFVTLVALPLARSYADAGKAGRCSRRSKEASRPQGFEKTRRQSPAAYQLALTLG
jgi:hypothetical protein